VGRGAERLRAVACSDNGQACTALSWPTQSIEDASLHHFLLTFPRASDRHITRLITPPPKGDESLKSAGTAQMFIVAAGLEPVLVDAQEPAAAFAVGEVAPRLRSPLSS
jgi:hypothetical protein